MDSFRRPAARNQSRWPFNVGQCCGVDHVVVDAGRMAKPLAYSLVSCRGFWLLESVGIARRAATASPIGNPCLRTVLFVFGRRHGPLSRLIRSPFHGSGCNFVGLHPVRAGDFPVFVALVVGRGEGHTLEQVNGSGHCGPGIGSPSLRIDSFDILPGQRGDLLRDARLELLSLPDRDSSFPE